MRKRMRDLKKKIVNFNFQQFSKRTISDLLNFIKYNRLFMAYLVYVLFNYIDDEKKYGKLIFTIPVLQILWVNFHGGSSSLPYIFIIGDM